MSDSDARDRQNLTLLVQLFGREVLDRLARAGFEDEVAIARAGADRLASESGISLSVAQRIVAVVEETRGSAPEPRRRKPSARRPEVKNPATRPGAPAPPAHPDLGDPFVDDVALVTWMGFSSKAPPSGRLSFSVADGILDPVRRESPAPEEASSPPPISPAAELLSGEKSEQGPRGQDGSGPPAPRTLPGSFWSFGHTTAPRSARDDTVARQAGRASDPQAPAGARPPRDRHDH